MTRNQAVTIYGEYGVPFEVAKKMKGYNFSLTDNEVLELYKEKFKTSDGIDNYYGGEEVLEFYNLDIELNITTRENEANILDFYICIKGHYGWDSHDFSDYVIKYEDLGSIDTLEEIMYREMIKYAEKYNLTWSKLN